MPNKITARSIASIPPFRIKLEEHEGGWDVVIGEPGDSNAINLGTFITRAEAEKAAVDKVTEELKKHGKEFPPTTTWTTTRALLLPEPVEGSVQGPTWRKLLNDFLPLTTGIVFIVLFSVISQMARQPYSVSPTQGSEIRKLSTVLADTKQEIDAVKQALKTSQSNSTSSGDVIALKSDVERLKERFAGFESALGDNLDKRIAFPMMRKDLDAIKEQYKVDLVAMDARLNLVVDLMKWVLGIIGLSGILSGLSNWFARPKATKDSATSTTGAVWKP
jgi:hypothetical protein